MAGSARLGSARVSTPHFEDSGVGRDEWRAQENTEVRSIDRSIGDLLILRSSCVGSAIVVGSVESYGILSSKAGQVVGRKRVRKCTSGLDESRPSNPPSSGMLGGLLWAWPSSVRTRFVSTRRPSVFVVVVSRLISPVSVN